MYFHGLVCFTIHIGCTCLPTGGTPPSVGAPERSVAPTSVDNGQVLFHPGDSRSPPVRIAPQLNTLRGGRNHWVHGYATGLPPWHPIGFWGLHDPPGGWIRNGGRSIRILMGIIHPSRIHIEIRHVCVTSALLHLIRAVSTSWEGGEYL